RTTLPGSVSNQLMDLPQRDAVGSTVFPGEVAETDNPAIFRLRDGQVHILAEAGQPFEDGSPYAWYQAPPSPSTEAPFTTPFVNGGGQVLLWAAWDSTGVGNTNSGTAPWILDPLGAATPVVLPGDLIEFGPGDLRHITPTAHHDGATAMWYRTTSLSEAGHVLGLVDSPVGWGLLYTDPPTGATDTPHTAALRGATIQLRPHPFRGHGTIQVDAVGAGPVDVGIYNLAGRLVRDLGTRPHGEESVLVRWDGRSRSGAPVAAGTYFVKVKLADRTDVQKIVLTR
ncbi:T9SS type A sorting domain-containing protein, partial [bacterium]|nr:T9SS type A sorting domain-containing protein [bacterium]